jgi:hypothetical protein
MSYHASRKAASRRKELAKYKDGRGKHRVDASRAFACMKANNI